MKCSNGIVKIQKQIKKKQFSSLINHSLHVPTQPIKKKFKIKIKEKLRRYQIRHNRIRLLDKLKFHKRCWIWNTYRPQKVKLPVSTHVYKYMRQTTWKRIFYKKIIPLHYLELDSHFIYFHMLNWLKTTENVQTTAIIVKPNYRTSTMHSQIHYESTNATSRPNK